MLNEQELIAYLENTLSPAERQRVEVELERDPQQRHQLVRQIQLDAALRASLGESVANERVRQSVLAVVRGESEEALKQKVLTDTQALERPANSKPPLIWEKALATLQKIISGGFEFAGHHRWATACVVLVCMGLSVWFFLAGAARRVELPVLVQLRTGTVQASQGKIIRAGSEGSASVKFADGTILHLEPGTEVHFVAVAAPPRHGGKQLKLISGSLSAEVAKQPEGLPLLIETPHALVAVVGTEFDLSVATNQTALEVTHGLVKMTGAGGAQPVSVAAGEFAVASAQGALQYGRLARNPYRWPFSSTSIWNRPLGSGAQFAPVPGKSFLAAGPLADAIRSRRPLMGAPGDPLRRIFVNGAARADVRLADANLPGTGLGDSVVLLQHARRYAMELHGVTVRPDGDLEATDAERVLLNGPGVMPRAIPALPFGLSNLGGLLRAGELETGIRHALSARVSRDRLAGRDFVKPLTIWPAAGNAAAATSEPGLCVGTLLAIPPDVDLRALLGENGPAYELARAMQDYGIYITGVTDAPFVLLADQRGIPAADQWLTQLVPLLQVVTNNSPENPAGGGMPRRESAPELPPR